MSSGYFTIFILALIIAFLLREGIGFSGQYRDSLQDYRSSGLEYVDILHSQYAEHIDLQQELTEIRSDWIQALEADGASQATIRELVDGPEARRLLVGFKATGTEAESYIAAKLDRAIWIKNELLRIRALEEDPDVLTIRTAELINDGRALSADIERYAAILERQSDAITAHTFELDDFATGERAIDRQLDAFSESSLAYIESIPAHLETLSEWEPGVRVPVSQALVSFFTGKRWITASDQNDWYGLLPLLSGSLLITAIALGVGVPPAVGAAIYINQIASRRERLWVKPYIEFISILPSVVVGFFGVMVFGHLMRALSQTAVFDWLPFFPIEERLNAFTAGCLLALMAIPTIFTLADEALSNVPKAQKEASFAVGATRLQTTFRTILPSALTGIISAVMLGFGRVIGETMIVLMCAGNRIRIPDLSEGSGVIFEPVHTMTGIIAQEMGEVVYGGQHYRALFMVGIVLFSITLIVNYGAQAVAKRFVQPTH